MARLRPKLRIFLVASFLYDLPRLYLNVNVFGSLCSFWHNVVKVGFVKGRFMPRQDSQTNTYPLHHFYDEYLPHYVLNFVNGWEQESQTYEMLHSSIALP